MAIEYPHPRHKHVKIVCTLEVGDKVTADPDLSYHLRGKTLEVLAIEHRINCQTGFMVKISVYNQFVDSAWLTKVEK